MLKWKELAKSKSELGNKINYVHNAITQHKIGQETSQESFGKIFKPVASKLDDVIDSNIISSIPKKRKRPQNKGKVPDYGINIDDEVEDMNLGDLFEEEEEANPPELEKQMGPMPPPYEEPQEDLEFFDTFEEPKAEEPKAEEAPPEYDEFEDIDYTLKDEDEINYILDDLDIPNYDDVNYTLNQDIINNKRANAYLKKMIKNAKMMNKSLIPKKTDATKKFNEGKINEATKNYRHRGVDRKRYALKQYIIYLNNLLEKYPIPKKGKGMKGRGILKKVEKERNRIKGYKANVTKKYNGGAISEAKRQIMNKLLDDKMTAFNKYIKDHKKKLELDKKIKGRGRRQRGGNVVFFNDAKQLLKKLELIIGEVLAGNTSIQMRNTGVNILDTLLRMSTINRPQYTKLYNQYFKV